MTGTWSSTCRSWPRCSTWTRPPSGTPQRGDLIDNPPKKVATYAPNDLLQLLTGSDLGNIFLQLAYTPKCTITVYHLTYQTADPKGNITPASGALMVPTGSAPQCSGGRPIVLYAHGTQVDKAMNIADPTNPGNQEGVLVAVFSGTLRKASQSA